MVQLRDRLAAAEAHRDDALDAAERAVESAARGDPSLTTRIDALEARLRSQAVASVTVQAPTEETPPEEIVRRHLQREGYTHVTIIDTDEEGRLLVEAERDGITRKGRVRIDANGRMVRWQPVSSLRAFP